MRTSMRRGFVVATAVAGLWALGAGISQADSAGTGSALLDQPVRGLTHEIDNAASSPTGVDKAVSHGKKEAAEAVPAAPATSSVPPVDAVSGLPDASGVPDTPDLSQAALIPEGTNITVPEVVPGVPSIGIIPLAVPELPVTPGVPAL